MFALSTPNEKYVTPFAEFNVLVHTKLSFSYSCTYAFLISLLVFICPIITILLSLIASVVGTKFNVLKTQGNLNNHIGLPLTILGLRNHEALVVEMGMNNLGEISVLSKIAKPNIAVITNVGTSHIGNLGSRENILKAKLEIIDGLSENGVLIINNDNDLLHMWAENENKNVKVYTYGIENESNLIANSIELKEDSSEFLISSNKENKGIANNEDHKENKDNEDNKNNNCDEMFKKNQDENSLIQCEKITVPVGGLHFVYNALSAFSVGKVLNIENEKIIEGIKKFELTKSRMELINISNNIIVINDCYNANYDSMKAAIEYLGKTKADRKIAVLGDMLELGEFSTELHEKVGNEVVNNKIDILVTVGKMGKTIASVAENANIKTYHCENNANAIEVIKNVMKENDIILVKASNGMKFKEIVEALKVN